MIELSEVLIIDDNSRIRELVRLVLAEDDYETIDAESGEEGLEILEERTPDLIILNLRLPDQKGWGVLDELDKRRIVERIPVMMLTGEDLSLEKMMRKDTEELSFYMEKPIRKDRLLEIVGDITDWWSKVREIEEKIEEESLVEEDLSVGFREWCRRRTIHECYLKKLEKMQKEPMSDKKRNRVKEFMKREKQIINRYDWLIEEILEVSKLKNYASKLGGWRL